jgi:translation initiation factor 3 subunit L
MTREEGLPAFEELFIYACPKFISANPPPYHDPALLSTYLATLSPSLEPAQHHLTLFLSDVRGQLAVPTLRSFLKLYTSLDAKKLAGFLDKDEEDVVQEMMVMKQSSRSVSRVIGGDKEKGSDDRNGTGAPGGLLDGQTISTSDLDFVIDEVNLSLLSSVEVLKAPRTWFILPSLLWADVMQVGSSGTRSMRSVSSMHFVLALFPSRQLACQPMAPPDRRLPLRPALPSLHGAL